MRILIIACLFFLNSSILLCCSCHGPKFYLPKVELFTIGSELDLKVDNSELVFEGILIKKEKDSLFQNRDFILTYEVTDVFVGNCIDTIVVKTAVSMASCGYQDLVGSYSIISTSKNNNGDYFIYRSDCSLNVSQKYQPDRYQSFRNLLIVTKYRLDGLYSFRANQFRSNGCLNPELSLRFGIANNLIDGEFSIQDSNGRYLMRGDFYRGLKHGNWKTVIATTNNKNEYGYRFMDSILIETYSRGNLRSQSEGLEILTCN